MSDNNSWEAGERKTVASVVGLKQPVGALGEAGFPCMGGQRCAGRSRGNRKASGGESFTSRWGPAEQRGASNIWFGGELSVGRALSLYSHLTLLL